MTDTRPQPTPEVFWEEFYGRDDRVWSGRPNPLLVREAAGLAPGTALDLGCGEGADAIWLAARGWQVTAVDVSATALERGAAHAAEAGVADRIGWRRHDLGTSFPEAPEGGYGLVSLQFLHSPLELPVERIVRSAAAAVAPGGVLLFVGHAQSPSWKRQAHADVRFPTADELLAAMGLPSPDRRVEVRESLRTEATGPDGEAGFRVDHVLRVRRLR
ncbi:methyltransferase domain-containing protein [Streptomyces mobaraensis NBRC 13819 = DSM 40847]|uniref:Methyltransferase domain-containing protein n=2 Tax=Streptomyces mobaraensis TaxID=35621 RepID=A0A5N5W7Q3_STRMB|nr:methyltransferase domain-containing protein [Streptomyces mobaraensis]EME96333.1 type 12 methyltransferase [Streptomyces mobaraensis NBRC 13819 = DSM 40847]KAB7844961.1 methyltransferase domain-containing protein [Streptomyces mobaraensis]QTT77162.1 methyltransferase domain-containing protein [Streptomyces mobaraensis NBRC 13819 = DSM 40847]